MDFEKYQAGEGGDWLNYANPQYHSRSAKEVVCEIWMELDIDWQIDPDNPRFLEKTIPIDITFHAKVLRYGNPQEEADEKYEEKTVTENLPVTVRITMDDYGGDVRPTFGFWSQPGADYAKSPSISGTFECSSDPCSNIQIDWKEPTSETDTTTPEEDPTSEVNASETVTDNPVTEPDSISPRSLNLSGTLFQGAVSAGAGFGLVEILKRLIGKTSMDQLTPKDLEKIKENMNQANTGSSESEDMINLPTEDRYQKRDRKKSRLSWKIWKKNFDDDVFYRKRSETKKWTPKQEQKAIRDAKPNWVNAYSEEFKSKRKGLWLNSTKFWDHYETLSDSQKFEVDSWKEWSDSWMRRHGAGKVGKLSDHSTAFTPGGSRA
jgi:hypothetical protein